MRAAQPKRPVDKIEEVRRSLESDHESCLPEECGVWLLRRSAPPELQLRAPRKKWIKLTVDDWLAIKPEDSVQDFNRVVGPVISGAPCWVPARTLYNRLNAIFFRVFRRLPYGPQPGLWELARTLIAPVILNEMLTADLHPTPWSEWIATRPPERVQPMLDAREYFEANGFTRQTTQFHAFMKQENMFAASKTMHGLAELQDAVPRLIQGPHDVTHVIAGPRITSMLKILKNSWKWSDSLYYASDTPLNLDSWLQLCTSQRDYFTIFWCDYTMFDSSYNAPAWNFVESLYGTMLGDADFRKVLEIWRSPQGKCGDDVKYRGGVMNASGRDDTAFANGVLNGVAMFASACASWYNVDLLALNESHLRSFLEIAKIAVCGDDSLGFLPFLPIVERRAFLERLRANIARFGFKAKAFASSRIFDAVFLGHRPLRVGSRWYWTRTIGRAIFKLGWQAEPRGDPAAHMTGIMDMHTICSPHVPIIADMANAWVNAHTGLKRKAVSIDPNKPWEWMTKGLVLPTYDRQTLIDCAAAYSVSADLCRGDLLAHDVVVTPADIQSTIDYVAAWSNTGLPHVLSHPVLKHIVWIDEQ